MPIKFLKYYNICLLLFTVVLFSCGTSQEESSAREEALQLYNSSMATAEDLTRRLSKTANQVKVLDNMVRNTDTAQVYILGQAYDDVENVKQLMAQWRRDVPTVSVSEENNADIPPQELLTKQKEFQEKIEYIRFRLDDIDKTIADARSALTQKRKSGN